jgi:hypothetical protein
LHLFVGSAMRFFSLVDRFGQVYPIAHEDDAERTVRNEAVNRKSRPGSG